MFADIQSAGDSLESFFCSVLRFKVAQIQGQSFHILCVFHGLGPKGPYTLCWQSGTWWPCPLVVSASQVAKCPMCSQGSLLHMHHLGSMRGPSPKSGCKQRSTALGAAQPPSFDIKPVWVLKPLSTSTRDSSCFT